MKDHRCLTPCQSKVTGKDTVKNPVREEETVQQSKTPQRYNTGFPVRGKTVKWKRDGGPIDPNSLKEPTLERSQEKNYFTVRDRIELNREN